MYDTWNDPYEIRNLANDKAYAKQAAEMLDWLGERERAKWGPVDVPAYGEKPLITKIPEPLSLELSERGIPNPWLELKPGNYFVVPFEQPNPLRFLYEGTLPEAMLRPNAAVDADLARYFCELTPHAVAR